MWPKEHGAWNALGVSLVAGGVALGEWNPAAIAACILWFSGFILRAPLSTAREYWRVDRARSRKALAFSALLALSSILCGWVLWVEAPPQAARLILWCALPLGAAAYAIAWRRRTLRFPAAEVVGFALLCLLAPVLYLTHPASPAPQAILLYSLIGGYFILDLFYVKTRQRWLGDARKGKRLGPARRLREGGVSLLLHALFPAAVSWGAPFPALAAGPLYAFLKTLGGILKGGENLPMMRLGLRELGHSLAYLGITLAVWRFSFPL